GTVCQAMGTSRAALATTEASRRPRSSLEGSPLHCQRHSLAPPHGRPLARHPGTLRTLAKRVCPVPAVAPRRHLGSSPHAVAGRAGTPGSLGSLVVVR